MSAEFDEWFETNVAKKLRQIVPDQDVLNKLLANAREGSIATWNAALDAADARRDCNAANFEDLYAK